MTKDEVKKYINDIAFSGAEEFLNKYKEGEKDSGIIGHFGLGFYSAFMVSKKVEIITKSYTKEKAAHWTCDGSPEYTIIDSNKTSRGTEVILHIDKDSKEFLDENRIKTLLSKYNKFMPVAIKFGTKEETIPLPKNAKKDAKPKTKTVDNIINNTSNTKLGNFVFEGDDCGICGGDVCVLLSGVVMVVLVADALLVDG
jgi:molecular chaperone HtpG